MESRVNICMVTYNRLYFTKNSINSILTHTKYPYKLTVVDNNSTDGTQNYLKKLYDNGEIQNLILLPENIGVAKASNLAWQMEDFKYYMKYDNDIVFNSGCWLTPMIEILEKIPELAIVGYSFEPWEIKLIKLNDYSVRIASENIGGACVLIPKQIKEKIGYWCEDYGLYSEEDFDYCRRIKHINKKFVYMENRSIGNHQGNGDLENDKKYFEWKKNQRREGLKTLEINFKKYKKDPNSLYITPGVKPDDFKEFIYRGE